MLPAWRSIKLLKAAMSWGEVVRHCMQGHKNKVPSVDILRFGECDRGLGNKVALREHPPTKKKRGDERNVVLLEKRKNQERRFTFVFHHDPGAAGIS